MYGPDDVRLAAITLGANVPPDVVAEVQQAEAQLADGSLQVFEGPIRNQKGKSVVNRGKVASPDKMSTFLVEGVIGEIPAEDEGQGPEYASKRATGGSSPPMGRPFARQMRIAAVPPRSARRPPREHEHPDRLETGSGTKVI